MTIFLTTDEIWFLKALGAAGERGRVVGAPASRTGLTRLVEVQCVAKHPQSERKTAIHHHWSRPAGVSGCATRMKAAYCRCPLWVKSRHRKGSV